MITQTDLQEAIAECQGQINPNASTCIKLAAFLTIQREMFGGDNNQDEQPIVYSHAEPPVYLSSGSEFSDVIFGMDINKVMEVIDELMQTVSVVNPKLYRSVIRKLLD